MANTGVVMSKGRKRFWTLITAFLLFFVVLPPFLCRFVIETKRQEIARKFDAIVVGEPEIEVYRLFGDGSMFQPIDHREILFNTDGSTKYRIGLPIGEFDALIPPSWLSFTTDEQGKVLEKELKEPSLREILDSCIRRAQKVCSL